MGTNSRRLITTFLAIFAIVGLGLTQHGDVDAASLKTRIDVKMTGALTNVIDFGQVDVPIRLDRFLDLTNGTGANQANTVWFDQRVIGNGVTEDLDLVGGGLVDPLGVAFAPAKIRAILIYSSPSNTVNLTLLGDVNSVPLLSTAATTVTLKPGGFFLMIAPDAAGIAVTAGTGDIVQVANGAASSTYDVIILGTTS